MSVRFNLCNVVKILKKWEPPSSDNVLAMALACTNGFRNLMNINLHTRNRMIDDFFCGGLNYRFLLVYI